jgi:hypothetical protein
MEEVSNPETSVNFYQTARRYNSEDSSLHTRRRENLKFHWIKLAQDSDHWLILVNTVIKHSDSIKDGEYLDQLSDC